MHEEPYKYGDDIVEWLALDEEVMQGSKRCRTGVVWQKREDEQNAKEWVRVLGLLAAAAAHQEQWRQEAFARKNEAATAIQAAWRTYALRCWEEAIAQENSLATRIQALWRGYSTRVRQTWRDCAKCLKHGICVETLDDEHVCRCCWGEAHPVEEDEVAPIEERDIWGLAT
jgi:hypothetical protein